MRSIKDHRWLIAALSVVAIFGAACSSDTGTDQDATAAPETRATTSDDTQSNNGDQNEINQNGGEESFEFSANDAAFDTDHLELPADTEIELTFRNTAGSDIPHNFAIYSDASASEEIFVGDQVSGGEEMTYTLPATPAGEYYFRCDVHPTMEGTVTFS